MGNEEEKSVFVVFVSIERKFGVVRYTNESDDLLCSESNEVAREALTPKDVKTLVCWKLGSVILCGEELLAGGDAVGVTGVD